MKYTVEDIKNRIKDIVDPACGKTLGVALGTICSCECSVLNQYLSTFLFFFVCLNILFIAKQNTCIKFFFNSKSP